MRASLLPTWPSMGPKSRCAAWTCGRHKERTTKRPRLHRRVEVMDMKEPYHDRNPLTILKHGYLVQRQELEIDLTLAVSCKTGRILIHETCLPWMDDGQPVGYRFRSFCTAQETPSITREILSHNRDGSSITWFHPRPVSFPLPIRWRKPFS